MRYFVLEGHRVREGTLQEYSSLIASDMRRVGRTAVGAVDVSTVFMMGATPPEFFETMVFGGDYDERAFRYRTWDEAAAGHERVVQAIREGRQP